MFQTPSIDNWVSFSAKAYRRLISLYPERFRDRFGEEMLLLFRDQCRAAAREGGRAGLAKVWLRTGLDLLSTITREHVAQIKALMNNTTDLSLGWKTRMTFPRVFVATVVLLFIPIAAVNFGLPKVYLSTARFEMPGLPGGAAYDPYRVQTEVARVMAKPALLKVVDDLNLAQNPYPLIGQSGKLTRDEAAQVLGRLVRLEMVRGTSLFTINVYSCDSGAAAKIANKLAENYVEESKRPSLEANGLAPVHFVPPQLVDTAVPGVRPVRPNIPLNLVLGLAASAMAGLLMGFGAKLLNRKPRQLA